MARLGKPASILVSLLAYAVALAAAAATLVLVPARLHPMAQLAAADGVATLVVFVFSLGLRNSSLYDPYWSMAPLFIAPWLAFGLPGGEAPLVRRVVVTALVALWSLRLTWNFYRGWGGLHHEDWRYVDLRRRTGRLYWPVSLLGIHLMPTLVVFLGCLSLWPALVTGTRAPGLLDVLAAAVTLAAVIVEGAADAQLRAFVARRAPGEILERGLWRLSRHPNYFGEILFWWGLWLFALAAAPGAWWTVAGPLTVTVLFLSVSLPMIERRSRRRRPGWDAYAARTRALVPWPPRRTGEAVSEEAR